MDDLLDGNYPVDKKRKNSKFLFVLDCISFTVYIVSFFVIFSDVHTIVVCGPILMLIGIVGIIIASIQRNLFSILLNAIYLLTSGIIIALINIFSLSPNKAQEPVSLIVGIFSVPTIVFFTFVCKRFTDRRSLK